MVLVQVEELKTGTRYGLEIVQQSGKKGQNLKKISSPFSNDNR